MCSLESHDITAGPVTVLNNTSFTWCIGGFSPTTKVKLLRPVVCRVFHDIIIIFCDRYWPLKASINPVCGTSSYLYQPVHSRLQVCHFVLVLPLHSCQNFFHLLSLLQTWNRSSQRCTPAPALKRGFYHTSQRLFVRRHVTRGSALHYKYTGSSQAPARNVWKVQLCYEIKRIHFHLISPGCCWHLTSCTTRKHSNVCWKSKLYIYTLIKQKEYRCCRWHAYLLSHALLRAG